MKKTHDGRGQSIRSLLYWMTVIVLIVVIWIMYAQWKDQKQHYYNEVKAAKENEVGYDIEFRKDAGQE